MRQPEHYAVIGNPIAHSKSPEIHAQFAAQTGQNIVYERLLAPQDGFVETVRQFIAHHGKGANITVPFKLEAHVLATFLTERAKAAGAVNTLKFDQGTILGDNTDGIGLVTDIVENARFPIAGKRILLAGAGGAARGVILPLLEHAPLELVIINRTHSKAEDLAKSFKHAHVDVRAATSAELSTSFDIVINATSASLQADLPELPPSVFTPDTLAYDMMYGKEPTVFMQFAFSHGAGIRDGLGMLVEQAAESFLLWRGVKPDTQPVLERLRAKL